MKKYSIFFLIHLVVISFYSCNNKKEPEPIVEVDSTLLKPKIEFDYQLLQNGGIKFTNRSKNMVSTRWSTSWYRSKAVSPVFYFEEDARYGFLLQTIDEKGRHSDTTFYLYIENTPKIKADSFHLKGVVFNKEYNIKTTGRNNFFGGGLASLPMGTPSATFQIDGLLITVADFNRVQGKDYQSMKNNFKLGKQILAQLKNYPTGDYSRNIDGWYFVFAVPDQRYMSGEVRTDSLEILEVEEFTGRKLFPEMDERGFWVTWHYKGETKNGKIDCILKVKYLIFETYIPF